MASVPTSSDTSHRGVRGCLRKHLSWLSPRSRRVSTSGSSSRNPSASKKPQEVPTSKASSTPNDSAVSSPSNGNAPASTDPIASGVDFLSTVHASSRVNTLAVNRNRATNIAAHADAVAGAQDHEPRISSARSRALLPTPTAPASLDLWSAAFREAVDALGDEVDAASLQGKSLDFLFKELEGIEHDKTEDSSFMRGVSLLRSLKGPLENFKLGLDLASPFTRLDPTVTTVFGVVASVTAVRPAPPLEPRASGFCRPTTDICEHR